MKFNVALSREQFLNIVVESDSQVDAQRIAQTKADAGELDGAGWFVNPDHMGGDVTWVEQQQPGQLPGAGQAAKVLRETIDNDMIETIKAETGQV